MLQSDEARRLDAADTQEMSPLAQKVYANVLAVAGSSKRGRGGEPGPSRKAAKSVTFNDLQEKSGAGFQGRLGGAKLFYELLVLKSKGRVQVAQEAAFTPLTMQVV